MGKRVTFSGEHLLLPEILESHHDIISSLKLYFSESSPFYTSAFLGYQKHEVTIQFSDRVFEVDSSTSLSILAALEAAFRMDYLHRCQRKKKDDLSRAFQEIYKQKGAKAQLDEDIFETWKQVTSGTSRIIGDLRGAFRFRNWLAHGRYWTPKFSRYEFSDIYILAQTTFASFPFYAED